MVDRNKVPISLRIENLPMCGYMRWIAIVVSIAMFAEAVEVNAFGYCMPLVQAEFAISPELLGWLSSANNMGMLLGAAITASLCDWIGRKKVFIICLFTWGLAGLAFAASTSIEMLFVFRAIFGIGAGAQVPASLALLAEMGPSKNRASFVVLSLLMVPFATIGGAGLATLILSYFTWRTLFVVVSCFALWVFVVIKALPESARWLESKNRQEEAAKIVTAYEDRCAKSSGQPVHEFTEEEVVKFEAEIAERRRLEAQTKAGFGELWSRQQIKHTFLGMIWPFCQMLVYFSLTTWLTTLLVGKGFTVQRSTGMIAIFATGGIPAYFAMVWILNKFGRKVANIVMALGVGAAAYVYGMQGAVVTVLICGFIYTFFQFGYNMTYSTYLSELFPTRIRGLGTGFASVFGRVGGISGPVIVGYIMGTGNVNNVFILIVAVSIVAACAIFILGTETKDKLT
ncbi:MAG: MFS transporter [Gracilibacteraceae bacterium]|jgi:putative MFS transporter|nr:MFS transporter [Gracilibacteraceae bacterium]